MIEVKVELGHRAVLIERSSGVGKTYDWTVFVRGSEGCDISRFVRKIKFRLPDDLDHCYPCLKRVCSSPPYEVSEIGPCNFFLRIEIYLKNTYRDLKEPKKIDFWYDLFMKFDSTPLNYVRIEKLRFSMPTDRKFKKKLLNANQDIGLPVIKTERASTDVIYNQAVKESHSQKAKTAKSSTKMDESDNIERMDEENSNTLDSSAATGTNSDIKTDNGKKRKSTESPTYNSVIKKKKRENFKPMDVGTLTSEALIARKVFLEKQLKESQNQHLLESQRVEEKANSIRKLLDMGYSWAETREALNQASDIFSAVDYLIDKQKKERATQHAGKSAGLKALLEARKAALGKPTTAQGKCTAALGKPTVALEKPTAAALEKPTAAALEKPTAALGKPTAALGKPPQALGTPAIGRPMSFNKLIDAVKKASLVAVKPTSGLRKPTHVTGKSADTLGNSTPVRNKPTPRLFMKIPATGGGKSRLIIENSTALTGKPPASTEPPALTGKPTMEAGKSTLNTRKPKDMASSSTATLAVSQIASTSESSEDESGSLYHSKANESYNKMEEELTCPICLELYDKPVILPCSHSLCKQCLENIAQSRERNGQEGVKCPSCRKVIKVTSEQVTLLPENLALKNTIFHFKQVSLHHQQIQNSRKKGETTNCCKDHSDKKVNMFCDQCKVLVCHLCLCEDQGQHIGHKVITKTSAASQIKEKLKLVQSALKPLVNTVQERRKDIKELCEDIEKVHNGACKQVEVKYSAVLKELQKKKELFVQTLTQEKTKAVSNLRRHEEQANPTLTIVERLIDSWQNILDESNIDEILTKPPPALQITHLIEDRLKKSELGFSELMRNCIVQKNLTEAVDKFGTALKDCVNSLSTSSVSCMLYNAVHH